MADKKYEPSKIESKWQEVWEKEKIYSTPEPTSDRVKKYVLDMFPYPSGAGLHVGHMEGYVGTDVISRYLRMKGFFVLHPMGWDAFGLPAENYAVKTGVSPDKSTHANIDNFRKQLKLLGLSYDWSKELDTSSPEYYKWTQWLFIQLFNAGLAYKKKAPVNWCPKDETVLANEQVVDGICERCGTGVVQKELEQWFFKITAYADKLIEGLDNIDWLEEVKVQQKNWIGRKEGVIVKFSVINSQFSIKEIEVFTTRPDTIFGATFLVLSPEHPIARELGIKVKDDDKEKDGANTGLKAVNPANGEEIPVWVSNYVISGTGTGAIMAVPFFDERDREFAVKFVLPIKEVEVEDKILTVLEKKGVAKKTVTYHIRDWLISRQRYWGCPIPMVFCEKCGWNPVLESELPVMLPTDVDFLPHGESPIARSETFQKGARCPKCGGEARREVDTMDTYVDSSWYFLAFPFAEKLNSHSGKRSASRISRVGHQGDSGQARMTWNDFKQDLTEWLPVDTYVGGGHVVQHLLFARFFWKALSDLGHLPKELGDEPFLRLRAPGWILGPDSRKMSKRWGNVITPEEVVAKHGADTMRTYEMFMGPFDSTKPWNTNSVAGVNRFLTKVFNLFHAINRDEESGEEEIRALHKLIHKVESDIEGLRFNTAVSSMMEFMNLVAANKKLGKKEWEQFLIVLAPFAPHLTEELWQELGHKESIHKQSWPVSDSQYLADSNAKVAVAINGKNRGIFEVPRNITENEMRKIAEADKKIAKHLEGQEIKKIVYVPGKILNFIV